MIEQIRGKFQRGLVEYSLHAVRRMIAREIAPAEILECVMAGEVIEDYPEDKYGPSCLIFGKTKSGRALHFQSTYPSRPLIKVITAYEPNPAEWSENLKERRK